MTPPAISPVTLPMTPPATAPTAPPGNPLDALLPNITPEPIGWFPLAPGWWILLILLLVAGIALLVIGLRYLRRTAYRRKAIRSLKQITFSYQQHGQMKQLIHDCNTLLKATALQAWPRKRVAALSGKAWLAFLDSSLPPKNKAQPSCKFRKGPGIVFGRIRYSNHKIDPRISAEVLLKLVHFWIREHRVEPQGGNRHD